MDDQEGFALVPGKQEDVLERKLIEIFHANDNEVVVFVVRQFARKIDFKPIDEFMIAAAASELTTNILRYAKKGFLECSIIKNPVKGTRGLELYACDFGQGIADIEKALEERFSTTPNSLGQGLPAVRRIMDEFYIESILGRGTRILTRKWEKDGTSGMCGKNTSSALYDG